MRRAITHTLSTRPAWVWAVLIGGPVALDVWCARNTIVGDSLSEVLRVLLRTDTPAGKVAVVTGWTALSAWFIPHLLKRVNEERI